MTASFTSRMVTLLGAFRRERNGLVADTMHYDGERYGLNYGVSLATVRQIVQRFEPARDEAFARFLMTQQVRCLQLAALHLADPAEWHAAEDDPYWLTALHNSELAEEAAYTLWSTTDRLDVWMASDLSRLPFYARYALLMAAARNPQPRLAWLDTAYEVALRDDHRLMRQALVALWACYANRGTNEKEVVLDRLATLGTTPLELYLKEELSWRIL